jgi:integrase
LNKITGGGKQQTKHGRYSHLKAFFNFIKINFDSTLQNPCDTPMLRKLYRPGKPNHWNIVGKETIDEVIFRTTKLRNRLILELMARGGMRVGEVLKLTPENVNNQKLIRSRICTGNSKSVRGSSSNFSPRPKLESLGQKKHIRKERRFWSLISQGRGELSEIDVSQSPRCDTRQISVRVLPITYPPHGDMR